MNSSKELILTVVELNGVKGKIVRSRVFHDEGGTIGSQDSTDRTHWFLQDNSQSISPVHASILMQDGLFCLEDISGQTFINSAAHCIGKGNIVALSSGDQIRLGKLTLNIQIRTESGKADIPDYQQLQTLIATEDKNDVNQVIDSSAITTPVQFLSDQTLTNRPFDPGTLGLGSPYSSSNTTYELSQIAQSADTVSRTEPMLDEEFIDVPNPERDYSYEQNDSQSFESVAITPLMRGMGCIFNFSDSQQANDFLEEAGRVLESAIRGMLLLEQDRIRINKQLQPVEDNPLRLGLDYDKTLETMFGKQQSQVHLTPSAAVWECLSFLRLHKYASRLAVNEALTRVVDTFSPDTLMTRFQRYRRDHMVDINDPSWGWEMYNHYFEELKSTRQQGIERLFQEVYEQVYDKALRDLREGEEV